MEDNNTKNIFYNSYKKRYEKPFEKKEKDKKRVETENWNFSEEYYLYENQIKMIKDIHMGSYDTKDEVAKKILQQINKKIYGYKQQDIIKKKFKEDKFITLESVLNKMVECQLKCHYCNCEMNVLYDISRGKCVSGQLIGLIMIWDIIWIIII